MCYRTNMTAVILRGRWVAALRPTASVSHVCQECSEEEHASSL